MQNTECGMKKTKTMKTKLVLFALVSAFSLQPSALLAQGSLTPPGAPAATMKTLAQIEPRTPISAAPFTISVPGSYYLTTNLTVTTGNAITIATNGVTLDLGGFTIASTAFSASGYGIMLNSGFRNLTLRERLYPGRGDEQRQRRLQRLRVPIWNFLFRHSSLQRAGQRRFGVRLFVLWHLSG